MKLKSVTSSTQSTTQSRNLDNCMAGNFCIQSAVMSNGSLSMQLLPAALYEKENNKRLKYSVIM